MRPGSAAIAGLLVGLALIFPACGGDETAATGIGASGGGGQQGADARISAANAGCRAQMRGVLGGLDRLRESLAVGVSYESYLDEVEGVKSAYAALPTGRLSLDCLTLVGTPAERALNQYISGVNTWGDCLARAGCEPTSIEAELKREWEVGSRHLTTAQDGLRVVRSQ